MKCGHLFSGIGGFALAADWMGWETLMHCEWDPFCQNVLKHHWPNSKIYGDITKTDFTIWRGRIDLLTGGFPCQPFSTAGQRKGTADNRYLWPQMLRAIREIAPRYILGENVSGIYTWNNGLVFETVCADLEAEGYEVVPICIPACATGAPHRRDRWWFVAHANQQHGQKSEIRPRRNQPTNYARNPDLQPNSTGRCPQDSEDAKCCGGAELAPHPPSQGLSQPRQPRIGQLPTQSEGRIYDRPELGGGHAAHIDHLTERGLPSRATTEYAIGSDPCGHAAHTGHTGLQRDELGPSLGQRPGPPRPIAQRFENEYWPEAAARLCSLDDGLSGRLDAAALLTIKPKHAAGKWRRESLKAFGNAIVPQVAFEIYKAIDASK